MPDKLKEIVNRGLSGAQKRPDEDRWGSTGQPQSIGNGKNVEKVEVQQYMQEMVTEYPKTAEVQDSRKVILDVKHIIVSFGFPCKVRNSKYAKNGKGSLLKACFRCVKRESCCPLRLTIRRIRRSPEEHEADSESEQMLFNVDFLGWHQHPHHYSHLQTSLLEYIWKELYFMRESSMIPPAMIVHYIEEKYGVMLRKESLTRKMRDQMRKRIHEMMIAIN